MNLNEKADLKARLWRTVEETFDSFDDNELAKLSQPGNADWLISEVERGCCKVVGRSTVAKSNVRA